MPHRFIIAIAAIAFLRMHKRTKKIGNFLTIWIEEMKNPPLTDGQVLTGLTLIPMQSSQWQRAQETDAAEMASDEGLFIYGGRFVPNPKLPGRWSVIGEVSEVCGIPRRK